MFEGSAYPEWTVSDINRLFPDELDCSIIALDRDQHVIGYALGHTANPFNCFMAKGESRVLRRLYVDPNARDSGLGSFLLREFIKAFDTPVYWQTSIRERSFISWLSNQGYQPAGKIKLDGRCDYIFHVLPAEVA